MKNLLLLTLICVVSVLVGLFVCRPVVEEYGVATIQYDEEAGTYFVEVTKPYEVKSTEEVKAGMLISYYKTDASSLCVSSKFETREMIQMRVEREVRSAGIITGIGIWCIGALFLLVRYFLKKRNDAKFRKS